MIQIESVHIRELRGIRHLTITPNRKNFVVSGPNGSGKSGVVDAIQFALTGEMSRLTGKGTGGLSVQRHGPHVNKRDDPGATEVSLGFYVPELNKSAVLTRSVKNAKKFQLKPDDPKIRAVIEEVADHPELSLSRREIIKFIIVEAGQRSKEIQALLQLEEIGQTRGVLKTATNKLSIESRHAAQAVADANDALRRHLDVPKLSAETILAAVNSRRRTLNLALIEELTPEADLSAGVIHGGAATGFDKASALGDVDALEQAESALADLAKEQVAKLAADTATLERDPALLTAIKRRSFVQRGVTLVDDLHCPLCDTAWESEEALRDHLAAKIAKAAEAEATQTRMLEDAAQVTAAARGLVGLATPVAALARAEGRTDYADELDRWSEDLESFASSLGEVESIVSQQERFNQEWVAAPSTLKKGLSQVRADIQQKPDQSATVVAQTFLTRAQDRLAACRSARRVEEAATKAVEAGRAVYNAYCDTADAYLTDLYESVEDEFGSYYREINSEDEGEFKAKLEPAEGGLDLEVAFYDKGMFPPGAYHSEGHQDGMGVCLYLALMKRLLADRFRFAVFDDVVMSVDQGHRKEFCRLLKNRFPETQFIITTHDKVWVKQMQTENVVQSKSGVAFHSWSVGTGPIVEEESAVWDQIEADIARGDMDVAAGRLRRHMEYAAGEFADQLGATPTYRGDFAYDLGDLLQPVMSRYNDLLKRAGKAAKAWGDETAEAVVSKRTEAWSEALAKYGGENWIVNKAVHFNEWATFTKSEFREVVEAFQALLAELRCANEKCESWLYVLPKKGSSESLRCTCGTVNLNLKVK